MKISRIRNIEHPMYKKVLELYQISFPHHEQRESKSQEEILTNDKYHFEMVMDGASFVGLVLNWEYKDYIYIEHFCIVPELRNRGYGQKILELMRERGKALILEIDPPVDEMSVRRKGFYERSGFTDNSYKHVHPPYHKGNKGHDLLTMSWPRKLTEGEYERFFSDLQSEVMKGAFE